MTHNSFEKSQTFQIQPEKSQKAHLENKEWNFRHLKKRAAHQCVIQGLLTVLKQHQKKFFLKFKTPPLILSLKCQIMMI